MDQTSEKTQAEQRGPPLPKGLYKVVNPLLKGILRSPLHKGISGALMILRWTGRKSGKKFSTPVGYVRQGSHIFVFTHSPWWKNFVGGAPVTMRIQGSETQGTAFLIEDPTEIKGMIQALVAAHGEERARQMGFWVDDLKKAAPEKVKRAVQGTYFIRIDQ